MAEKKQVSNRILEVTHFANCPHCQYPIRVLVVNDIKLSTNLVPGDTTDVPKAARRERILRPFTEEGRASISKAQKDRWARYRAKRQREFDEATAVARAAGSSTPDFDGGDGDA